jgi:peptide/nickel transport system substrate-binding protein
MELTRRALLGSALAASATPAAAASQVMRIGITTSLVILDPLRTTLGDEYIYDNLVFNGLTRMNADLSVVPDLAESWSSTEDLKQWTFTLRRGVKFHNGREMVADDIVAGFKRLLDPKSAAPSRSNYVMIAEISAPDPYKVRFDLSYPYSGFAEILADRQVKIVPRDMVDQLATKPIGTGPFMFQSYTPGDRLVMVKNTNYFEPGLPKLDGVELRVIPEMSVKIAALQAGDIDVIWDMPPDQVPQLRADKRLRVESVATASWDAAIMNNITPPFNDVRVRRAFHLAVDKRDLVDLVLFGEGVPTIGPIPPTHPFYARDIVINKADPPAARKLLAEAGHPNGIKIPIVLPVGRPVRERMGVALQQLALPGGFDLQLQRMPYSSFDAEVSGKAPIYVDGFFARPTVDTSTYPFFHSQGSWNPRMWHYSNPDVDKALDAARRTGNTDEQKAQYIAMQHGIFDDPPGYIAYAANFICGYRQSVQNVETHPMRWFDLRHATMS